MSKNLHTHLLLVLTLSLLFISLNYASISVPANIVYYIPITFTNQQSTAVAPNTPLMIPFNALAYQSYETTSLNNTEFFFANGTIMPSWIEGNILNESSTALSTATNVIIWVKSPNTDTFLTANTGTATTATVYMGFAGTGATTQNMLFSNTITGEAPQLSPSYAEYDDGASVFSNYWNFAGTSLPSGWTISSGTYTQNNGITLSTSATLAWSLWYNTGFTYPFVVDSDMRQETAASANWGQLLALSSSGTSSISIWAGVGTDIAGTAFQYSSSKIATGTSTLNTTYVFTSSVTSSESYFSADYSQIGSQGTPGPYVAAYGGGSNIFIQWIRTRAYPPNGVAPNTTFDQIQPAVLNTSIFSTTWNTLEPGSPSNEIVLPISGNYNVYWGDGTNSLNTATHIYSTPGIYTINIINLGITGFRFNDTGDRSKIITINQWGNITLGNSGGYFYGANNLNVVATDSPDLAGTTNLSYMFTEDPSFNSNIVGWNTKNVTNMSSMFAYDTDFNQPIGSWNTSRVTNMSDMFYSDTNFNQNISQWNTANVVNTYGMFDSDTNFNQPIGSWNTNSLTDSSFMFDSDTNFNQPIGSWNTNSLTDSSFMFAYDANFNQNISHWNTAHVTDMSYMFYSDTNFNQNISDWNTSSATTLAGMFALDTGFNQPIGSWNTAHVTSMLGTFYNTNFNQNISHWNTSRVTNMKEMFYKDTNFNQPIGSWNTNSLTDSSFMFAYDANFNQNIGSWNTAHVTDMSYMFYSDTNFNQNIGSWNTSSVTTMLGMFSGDTLSIPDYDALLTGWASRTEQHGVTFNAGNSEYSSCGVAGRNTLINTYGWSISDGGENTGYSCISLVTITVSSSKVQQGGSDEISASVVGGTTPYAFNFSLYNSSGKNVYKNLTSNDASTRYMNSFTILKAYGTGTFTAKITVTANNGAQDSNTIIFNVTVPQSPSSPGSSAPAYSTVKLSDNLNSNEGSSQPVINAYVLSTSGNTESNYKYAQSQLPARINITNGKAYAVFNFACSVNSTYNYTGDVYGLGVVSCGKNYTVYGGSYEVIYSNSSLIQKSSTTTTTTTTSISTTTATTTIATTVPIEQPIKILVAPQNVTSPQLCDDQQGYNITYASLGTSFKIAPGVAGCFNITAINSTAVQSDTSNYGRTLIQAINFTESNSSVTVNATLHYPCSINSSRIAPFILRNGVWDQISPFTVNAASCTISFVAPSDPVIAIFSSVTSGQQPTSLATSIPPIKSPSPQLSYLYWLALIVILAIIAIVAASLLRRRRT